MKAAALLIALGGIALALPVAMLPRPAAAQSYEFHVCQADSDTDAMTSSQRLSCAHHDMRRAARQLTATFQRALRRVRPDQRHALRVQERAWIAHRRETCAPERMAANRSQDYNRMLCLIRETDAQAGRLRH